MRRWHQPSADLGSGIFARGRCVCLIDLFIDFDKATEKGRKLMNDDFEKKKATQGETG